MRPRNQQYFIIVAPALVLAVLLSVVFTSATGTAAASRVSTTKLPRPILFPTIQQAQQLPHTRAGNSAVLGSGDLTYHDGPVQDTTPGVLLIFWGASWQNSSGGITSDGQAVQRYFSEVSRTTFSNIISQYYGASGYSIPNSLTYGGSYLDASTPPTDSSCGGPTIEDSAIRAEVQTIVTQNWLSPGIGYTFFVFTPQGDYVNDGYGDCSDQTSATSFCSYHGATYISQPSVSPNPILQPYTAMPYPLNQSACPALGAISGDVFADSLINLSSYEQFATATDPTGQGWYDSSGYEIGAKCAWDTSGGLADLNSNGGYALQNEYSNASHSCVGGYLPLYPNSFHLATPPGTSPAPQTFLITNQTAYAVNWSLGSLPSWVTASPSSGSIGAGNGLNVTLTFHTPSTTPQTYSTVLTIMDVSVGTPLALLPVTVVAANGAENWYFAEGYTGGSFSEYLTLENPNATATTATVTYLLDQGQAPIVKTYSLAANSRTTLLVNNEIGAGRNVSMVVSATQPIIAERPMYFTYTALPGYTIPGGTDVLGATGLGQSFDFGYIDTTPGHDPYLTFLNPNGVAMNATIQYFAATGGTPIVTHHTYPANSRGTINVRTDEGLAAGTYSAFVSLGQPGLVERPLYLKDSVTGYTGSADVIGVTQPQTGWYFAEGYTNTNFSERYYLSNPNTSQSANVIVTFIQSNGPLNRMVSIPAGGQVLVDANAILGNNVNNSVRISANQPILAERFMSFDYTAAIGGNQNPSIPGATDVLGTDTPGNLFYFAEGYDGTGFAEYLTIENPAVSQTATVTVTFYPDTGAAPTVKTYAIAASTRFTLFTADVMPNAAFSMQVESDVAIVAERPMYFNYLTSGQTGGSDVVGYQP